MKVLISGATGAVAQFVITELADRHALTLFVRRPVESNHSSIVGDLRSMENCRQAVAGIEAIVHLGAISEPSSEAFDVNVQGTYHLLEAAREAGLKRVIFASSNCVYGHCYRISDRPFPLQFLPIDESHPGYPEDNYGLSKLLAEELLATYSRTWGMQTASLRLNWVWGPKEIEWRRGFEELDLARYAPYFWAYVDGRDVARAVRQALEAPGLPAHGTYNISADDHMADESSAELLGRFYPQVTLRHDLPGRSSFFSWRAAEKAFGYQPQHSWREA
jgi:nucleoside-diphosphate-sugar epimerase